VQADHSPTCQGVSRAPLAVPVSLVPPVVDADVFQQTVFVPVEDGTVVITQLLDALPP